MIAKCLCQRGWLGLIKKNMGWEDVVGIIELYGDALRLIDSANSAALSKLNQGKKSGNRKKLLQISLPMVRSRDALSLPRRRNHSKRFCGCNPARLCLELKLKAFVDCALAGGMKFFTTFVFTNETVARGEALAEIRFG